MYGQTGSGKTFTMMGKHRYNHNSILDKSSERFFTLSQKYILLVLIDKIISEDFVKLLFQIMIVFKIHLQMIHYVNNTIANITRQDKGKNSKCS